MIRFQNDAIAADCSLRHAVMTHYQCQCKVRVTDTDSQCLQTEPITHCLTA